jgi:hypothetical protein
MFISDLVGSKDKGREQGQPVIRLEALRFGA